MPKPQDKCEDCRYYREMSIYKGFCVRFPPECQTEKDGSRSRYPCVKRDGDPCGEFKAA